MQLIIKKGYTMKHTQLVCILFSVSSFLCAENNGISSQFLKLLVSSEPVVEKVPDKAPIKPAIELAATAQVKKSLATSEKGLDRFFTLLTLNGRSNQKKLHRADLESFNFQYITDLKYDPICGGFPDFDESQLTKEEKRNTKKYGKLIAQEYEAPWYMLYINEQIGYGVYADDDIEEGHLIGEYTGTVIETYKAKALDMSYAWTMVPPANYSNRGDMFFIDAKKAGNFVRFINHSYYPNVKPLPVYSQGEWHMIYIAQRAIKKDEQLLVDYGAGYWTTKAFVPVELALQ